MTRRTLDFYPTPALATARLLDLVPEIVGADVLEPCAGEHAMTAVLLASGCDVATNDLNPSCVTDWHEDAAWPRAWERFGRPRQWVVTNPPFVAAAPILVNARRWATVGVAMLLRLSFLEPTEDRGPILAGQEPADLIVMPRISFTGDGGKDNVTTAWMVWYREARPGRVIVVPSFEAPSTSGAQPSLLEAAS
ncbi:MAG: hypothetical protein AB7O67_16690 [Vicinamibacterales bacterium]